MTPAEYKKFKNLKRENLRDHMTDLELESGEKISSSENYLKEPQSRKRLN